MSLHDCGRSTPARPLFISQCNKNQNILIVFDFQNVSIVNEYASLFNCLLCLMFSIRSSLALSF